MNYNPETHCVVPKEPTNEMYDAAYELANRSAIDNYGAPPPVDDLWFVMCEAAPQPQQSAEPEFYYWEHKEGSVRPTLSQNCGPHPDYEITPLFTAPPNIAEIQAKAILAAAIICDGLHVVTQTSERMGTSRECAKAVSELAEKVLKGEVKL